MELSSIAGTLIAAGMILLIFLMVGGAVYASVRQVRRYRSALRERGLAAQPVPDPALVEGMRKLNPDSRLENVYWMDKGGYQVYLFELWGMHAHDDSPRSYSTIALRSLDFRLPRFILFPNLKIKVLGSVMDWVMQKVIQRFAFQRVTFPESHTFDSAYLLAGLDEPALRQFFTLERLNRLGSAAKNYQIDGLDDLLTFSRLDLQAQNRSDPQKIAALLEGAAVLYAIFRD